MPDPNLQDCVTFVVGLIVGWLTRWIKRRKP